MNTVRIILTPEEIIRNIKALPQGGLIQQTSIRAIGNTFAFDYTHPEIEHPFEVMELRQWIARNAERGTRNAELPPVVVNEAQQPPADLPPADQAPEPTDKPAKKTKK